MPPELQALLILTRKRFPQLENVACEMEAIVKGGSDRHFYRIQWAEGSHPPMVLMVYTLARRDNPKFVPATKRLKALEVHVPEIFAFDEDRLCVWLQDLGRDDLHAHSDAPWSERRPLYEATLREAAKIHAVGEKQLSTKDKAELEPPFDESLYLWEQEYFLDHFVRGFSQRNPVAPEFDAAHEELRKLRKRLSKEPKCLVHRDFQSQNVLIRNEEAWLVDYQGLRLGLAGYDLASLLFDPYVEITRSQRQELLAYYANHRGIAQPKVKELFYLCAAQRLMQALGAYANLSRNLGKARFEQHIPAAVKNLSIVCEEAGSLSALRPLFVA